MLEAQYLSMIALGFGSFIFGMMPLKLSTRAKKSHPFFLSLLLCLGGGVLLATSLVHMLAEVNEKLENYAELYFCAGFFLLYTIDEITHYCLSDPSSNNNDEVMSQRSNNNSDQEELLSPTYKIRPRANTTYGTILTMPSKNAEDRRKSYSGDSMNYTKDYLDRLHASDYYRFKSEGIRSYQFSQTQSCCNKHSLENRRMTASYPSGSPILNTNEIEPRPSTSNQHAHSHHSHDHDYDNAHKHSSSQSCHVNVGEPCVENRAGVIGLLIALLIHSILEGTSIGVQTNSSEVLLVLGAVSCHKLVLAFCLGIELSSSGYQSFNFVAAILVFSLGAPIGIAIGMSLTSVKSGILSLEGPLQAIAAGSLLYVAAFEVLPRERFKYQHSNDHKSAGLLQLIFVSLGFACITLLNIFVVSEHDYLENRIHGNSSGV